MTNHANILIVGSTQFHTTVKVLLNKTISIEYINSFESAQIRLHRNNFDVLLVDGEWNNHDNIVALSKLSYAMGKPIIVIYNNWFKYLRFSFWYKFSRWTNNHKLTSQLITPTQNFDIVYNSISKFIDPNLFHKTLIINEIAKEFKCLI